MRFSVGIVGYGYWGPILLRNFLGHEGFHVKWVCDKNQERREAALAQAKTVQLSGNVLDLLLDKSIDAVVISTQASTHFILCREAMLHGKHVFIEKPLALSYAEAEELCHVSETTGKSIFVDHIWLFSAGYQKLREILRSGQLGKIHRISSRRCDFGLFQKDANVLWHLMYHDVYLLEDLLGEAPLFVQSRGTSIVLPGIVDGACAMLCYPGDIQATILCDMYFPKKMREFIVQCELGILVWDETQKNRLCIVNRYAEADVVSGSARYYGDIEMVPVPLEEVETLQSVIDAFHRLISDVSISPSACRLSLQTVKTIEMLNEALGGSYK